MCLQSCVYICWYMHEWYSSQEISSQAPARHRTILQPFSPRLLPAVPWMPPLDASLGPELGACIDQETLRLSAGISTHGDQWLSVTWENLALELREVGMNHFFILRSTSIQRWDLESCHRWNMIKFRTRKNHQVASAKYQHSERIWHIWHVESMFMAGSLGVTAARYMDLEKEDRRSQLKPAAVGLYPVGWFPACYAITT